MSTTLTGQFETRREAEMNVERLVQEYEVDRASIQIAAAGHENSAGDEQAGSDSAAGPPTPESRDDAALHGKIVVSVNLSDEELASKVRAAFAEFDASDVEQG